MRIGISNKLPEPKYAVLERSIRSMLFDDGSQGWLYDDDDLSTLFQDSAGTTPVTAVEQSVGLQLDKSRGLVLGPEQVTNGDFSAGSTGWVTTVTGGNAITISSGSVRIQATGADTCTLSQFAVVSAGKWYRVEFDVLAGSSGQLKVLPIGGATAEIIFSCTPGRKTFNSFVVSGTQFQIARVVGQVADAYIDNISVRELPGNHRYATASGNRPVWSKRVNLLTKTEQFNDAAWVKTNTTVTANATTAPNGTLTADAMFETVTLGVHVAGQLFASGTVRASISLRKNGRDYALFGNPENAISINFVAGTASSASGSPTAISCVSEGDGWFRVSFTATFITILEVYVYSSIDGVFANRSYAGDPTKGIFIWGADLRPANQATGLIPLYQRVNTSTDYDTNGFPGYLKADGTDDFLVTNSIDFTATDKVTLCAGVRKLSDVAGGIQSELSSNSGANNGTFFLVAPSAAGLTSYGFRSRGTVSADAISTAFTSPTTNVLTGIGEISTDTSLLQVNGTQVATSATDQGTGNFGNYPAYFFRRGGTTFPFNGYEYGNICVGKLLTADQLAALEQYMNEKTRAY